MHLRIAARKGATLVVLPACRDGVYPLSPRAPAWRQWWQQQRLMDTASHFLPVFVRHR